MLTRNLQEERMSFKTLITCQPPSMMYETLYQTHSPYKYTKKLNMMLITTV